MDIYLENNSAMASDSAKSLETDKTKKIDEYGINESWKECSEITENYCL